MGAAGGKRGWLFQLKQVLVSTTPHPKQVFFRERFKLELLGILAGLRQPFGIHRLRQDFEATGARLAVGGPFHLDSRMTFLRGINPVLQHQAGDIGEVAGVTRDKGEAVGQGRTTNHQVKIIDGPAHYAQAHFLGAIYFKADTD